MSEVDSQVQNLQKHTPSAALTAEDSCRSKYPNGKRLDSINSRVRPLAKITGPVDGEPTVTLVFPSTLSTHKGGSRYSLCIAKESGRRWVDGARSSTLAISDNPFYQKVGSALKTLEGEELFDTVELTTPDGEVRLQLWGSHARPLDKLSLTMSTGASFLTSPTMDAQSMSENPLGALFMQRWRPVYEAYRSRNPRRAHASKASEAASSETQQTAETLEAASEPKCIQTAEAESVDA